MSYGDETDEFEPKGDLIDFEKEDVFGVDGLSDHNDGDDEEEDDEEEEEEEGGFL
jgi:hypothetical protein